MSDVKSLTVNNIKYTIKDNTARTTANAASAAVTAMETRVSTLETASANHVTLNTAQSITGTKTFTGSASNTAPVIIKASHIDYTTTPSTDKYNHIIFHDNNSKRIGCVAEGHISTTGDLRVLIQASRDINGVHTYGPAVISGIKTDGTGYTMAQTTSVATNNDEIATTAYVNNKFVYCAALPESPDSNTFYFIPE